VNRYGPVLLFSGLPLERKSSFLRQLEVLADVWRRQGIRVHLGGPVFPDDGSRTRPSWWGGEAAAGLRWQLEDSGGIPLSFAEVVTRANPRALIALGYPDQFPFLQATKLPCYLWSQFSRPPKHPLPQPPTYVPLTEKTASHLGSAGCSRIGPVIPHGVDTSLFSPLSEVKRIRPRRRHRRSDTFVIGTVAGNSRRKRLDLIVRSFALFCREHSRSRLLIKTNRPVSLDGVDLTTIIAREDIETRVEIIVAELKEAEMAELFERMDLYLNLSEWEGFCIPVIEALACGVPVVSLPIQGPGEILPYADTLVPDSRIREEEGTTLYEANPQAVSAVLSSLAESKELRERLSRQGREAALSGYDIRRIALQWEQLLQRI
jgi:glycosyltransferase involved in cell wall biosynthesis